MKTILILSLFFSLPLYGNEKAPAEAKPKESKASKDLKFRENAFLEIDIDDDDMQSALHMACVRVGAGADIVGLLLRSGAESEPAEDAEDFVRCWV